MYIIHIYINIKRGIEIKRKRESERNKQTERQDDRDKERHCIPSLGIVHVDEGHVVDGVATLEQWGPGLTVLPLHAQLRLRLGGVQRHRGQLGPGLAAHRAAGLALAAALVAKLLAEAQLLLNLNTLYYQYIQMDETPWTNRI